MSTAYQQNTNVYKPSEAKIRRVQTPPQYQVLGGGGGNGAAAATATAASATATASSNNIAGITNLTVHQHSTMGAHNSQALQQQQQHQQHQKHMDSAIKPDTHGKFVYP